MKDQFVIPTRRMCLFCLAVMAGVAVFVVGGFVVWVVR